MLHHPDLTFRIRISWDLHRMRDTLYASCSILRKAEFSSLWASQSVAWALVKSRIKSKPNLWRLSTLRRGTWTPCIPELKLSLHRLLIFVTPREGERETQKISPQAPRSTKDHCKEERKKAPKITTIERAEKQGNLDLWHHSLILSGAKLLRDGWIDGSAPSLQQRNSGFGFSPLFLLRKLSILLHFSTYCTSQGDHSWPCHGIPQHRNPLVASDTRSAAFVFHFDARLLPRRFLLLLEEQSTTAKTLKKHRKYSNWKCQWPGKNYHVDSWPKKAHRIYSSIFLGRAFSNRTSANRLFIVHDKGYWSLTPKFFTIWYVIFDHLQYSHPYAHISSPENEHGSLLDTWHKWHTQDIHTHTHTRIDPFIPVLRGGMA